MSLSYSQQMCLCRLIRTYRSWVKSSRKHELSSAELLGRLLVLLWLLLVLMLLEEEFLLGGTSVEHRLLVLLLLLLVCILDEII